MNCKKADKSLKKILFVMNSLGGGGAERVGVHLINSLNRNGYKIQIIIVENNLEYLNEIDTSAEIICLKKKHRRDVLKIVFKLNIIIRKYKPDVIISFLFYPNIITTLATLFYHKNIKLLLCEHTFTPKSLSEARYGNIKKRLVKTYYRKAHIIVAVSKSIANSLEKEFKIKPEKIKIIYNPIPLEEIKRKSKEYIEHPFFKIKHSKVIISAGRLVELKRFDRLLRVFSMVRKKHKNAYLIILGKGNLLNKLENLASQLKIEEWVDFVGFKPNPYAWMAKADIFALSSDLEGFPMTVLEAMACGVPVISTGCESGPKEIIAHGENGLIVPPNNENAFKQGILTLLEDSEMKKKFSENGEKTARRYDVYKIVSDYEKLF